MEAILKFNLEDRDDKFQFNRCCKSTAMAISLFNINNARSHFKNKSDITAEDVFLFMESQINDNNINLDEIIE